MPVMVSPWNLIAPLASWISTLCGTLLSSFLKSIVNECPLGAWSVAVENAMFCALNGTPVPAGAPEGPPDGGGAGVARALSTCSATQASNVGRGTAGRVETTH